MLFYLAVLFIFNNKQLIAAEKLSIACLDPASCELLVELEQLPNIKAVSDLANFPKELQNKNKIGAYKSISIEKLIRLKIQHIVFFDLGFDELEQQMRKHKISFTKLQDKKLSDYKQNILNLAKDLNLPETQYLGRIQNFENILLELRNKKPNSKSNYKSYIVQLEAYPVYLLNSENYLSEFLELCHLKNISPSKNANPIVQRENAVRLAPDLVLALLPSSHKKDLVKFWPAKTEIHFLDPDLFSRFTSRQLQASLQFCKSI